MFENTNCIILHFNLAKSRFFCFFAISNNYRFAMNHDIFISYSHMQKSIADGVCHYLEENGFKCWMAPRDIPAGSEYGNLIEDAIKACKVVVLVFSEAASMSKWVKGEINVAFTDDKPILPFRVDESETKGSFRLMLNQMHWIDAYPHYADRLPDLLDSISGLLVRFGKNEHADEKPSLETGQQITKCVAVEETTLKEDLLTDMRGVNDSWNYAYKSNVMQLLFGLCPSTEEQRADPSPIGRFLKAGLKLTMDDLHRAGVIPEGNLELEKAIFETDFEIPQLSLEEIGKLYPDRTDVYFLGVPNSGKSCIFACLSKYFRDHGIFYEPHFNDKGVDACYAYYCACIEGLNSCNAPRSTSTDTLSFLHITTNDKRHNKLTIVDSSGEAISGRYLEREAMKISSVGRCLLNDNPKALFFLFDYGIIIGKAKGCFSRLEQELLFEQILLTISNDGSGEYGDRGCTMSKVKTVGIIITKSDLMDVEIGRLLSTKERDAIALSYLEKYCAGFMANLRNLCKKYHINSNLDEHKCDPYVSTFCTGKFYVGNTVVYDETDTERLAKFLLNKV